MISHWSFNPPLNKITGIPCSTSFSQNLSIILRVTLPLAEYKTLLVEGRQVEAWSDMPGEDVKRGEWGRHTFTLPHSDQDYTQMRNPSVLSLLPIDPTSTTTKNVTLTATFTVPPTLTQYQYTFRISGPGQRVDWLGHPGNNGVISVEAHHAGFREVGNWLSSGSDRVFDGLSAAQHTVPAEVGHFDDQDMAVWIFNEDGPALYHPREGAESPLITATITHLPGALAAQCVAPPPSLLIHSNRANSMLWRGRSLLSMSSSTIVSRETNAEDAHHLSDVLTRSMMGHFIASYTSESHNFLLVAPTLESSSPLPNASHITILPATAPHLLPDTSLVSLPGTMLDGITAAGRQAMLYSPLNETWVLTDHEGSQQPDMSVNVAVGKEGGELVVLQQYSLRDCTFVAIEPQDSKGEIVAVPSPLSPPSTSRPDHNPLITPKDSPSPTRTQEDLRKDNVDTYHLPAIGIADLLLHIVLWVRLTVHLLLANILQFLPLKSHSPILAIQPELDQTKILPVDLTESSGGAKEEGVGDLVVPLTEVPASDMLTPPITPTLQQKSLDLEDPHGSKDDLIKRLRISLPARSCHVQLMMGGKFLPSHVRIIRGGELLGFSMTQIQCHEGWWRVQSAEELDGGEIDVYFEEARE